MALKIRRFQHCVLLLLSLGLCGATTFGASLISQEIFSFRSTSLKNPCASLWEATDGLLYGITQNDTADGDGLYRLRKDGSGFQVLRRFATNGVAGNIMQASDGKFYGIEWVYTQIRPDNIYRINPDGSGYEVLHQFANNEVSEISPRGRLLETPDGMLYGTTYRGGNYGQGTIFRIARDGSEFQTLYHFGAETNDGVGPSSSLLLASNGSLYGVTRDRAADDVNRGVIFKIERNGTDYRVLHRFGNTTASGWWPSSSLLEASDGMLYGSTASGGYSQAGQVFRLQKDGTGFEVIHQFQGDDGTGDSPFGTLVEGADGFLYGTTQEGGLLGSGTIYWISKSGEDFGILEIYLDDYLQGNGTPSAGLLLGSDGAFYAAIQGGGTNINGSIRRLGMAVTLAIENLGTNLLISWPVMAGTLQLEQGSLPGPAANWIPVEATVSTNGSLCQALFSSTNRTLFFRLHRP